GTTNYILTKMDKEGADFEEVLKEAQDKGYAERNPEADVEGYDACRKIAILSSLMCGKNVGYEEIYTEGITKISSRDFLYAKQMDKSIKLLAMSRDREDGFFAMVAPFLIPRSHPLYSVNGVFNAVYVHGNMLGDSMYYGRGAGKLPTASAVVSDVVDCARHLGKTVMCFWENEDVRVADIETDQGKYFVRVDNGQREAVMEAFGALAEISVGISEEFAFITQVMTEREFNEKIKKAGGCINRIRMLSA
ncbi:MAG: homoserine dehydrogenase, partial [Lachnospiraceae bacterium]|nr:homoserine dehydrogenase [Lachnospiraceae bacterium]